MKTEGSDHPLSGRCRICDTPLTPEHLGVLCADHDRQRDARHRAGVGADELDARWGDRLGHWNDRPTEVTEEEQASFTFWRRVDHWLVFRRTFVTRLPDWIAVEADSRRVRRIVEVGTVDLVGVLIEGAVPAQQEDLTERWGKPQTRRLTTAVLGAEDRPSSGEMLRGSWYGRKP